MAFDKEEIKQLKSLFVEQRKEILDETKSYFEDQRSVINYDFKVTLNYELMTIKNDIEHIKKRLDQFFETETEDVKAAYDDIADLQKRVKKMELELAAIKK